MRDGQIGRVRCLQANHVAAHHPRQRVGRAVDDEAAAVQDEDVIGGGGFVEQVRGEHDGRAVAGANRRQVAPQIASHAGVQARGRLVEQQQRRARHQHLGDLGAPLEAARQARHDLPGPIGQADARQRFVDSGAQRPALQAVEPSVVQEVLAHREPLVECRRLKDDAQPSPHGRGIGPHVGAEHQHRAFRGALQRRADAEQRGLAAAVGPEQRDKRARRHRQRHVVERDAAAVAVREMADVRAGVKVPGTVKNVNQVRTLTF